MEIFFNGDSFPIENTEEITLAEFLSTLHFLHPYFAVAVNEIFIPKTQYEQTKIHQGDRIEIISPHPGG